MEWGEFKTYAKQKLQYHGDAVVDLADIGIGSAFDTRLQILLKAWERDVYALYTPKVAMTLLTTTQKHSFQDPRVCTIPLWEVERVWVSGGLIQEYRSLAAMEIDFDQRAVTSGKPTAWSHIEDSVIYFNRQPDQAYSNSFAAGYHTHATYRSDKAILDIPDHTVEACTQYVAVGFMEGAVSERGGMKLLERYDQKAYFAMSQIKNRNLARRYNGMSKGEPGGSVLRVR